MNENLDALEEFVLGLAERKPMWSLENSTFTLRFTDRRYFVIDELDAGVLEALRSVIPRLVEESRKARNSNE